MAAINYNDLLPPFYKEDIKLYLKEDCPSTDIGGFVVGDKIEVAYLYCKDNCILAGLPFAQAVFDLCELDVEWLYKEGVKIDLNEINTNKIIIAIVKGKCKNILIAERTALNILSRASGVATQSNIAVNIAKKHNWNGYVAGTRKTTPGFRNIEKYALLVGGAATHRLDLSQMVMLKDNHIASAGGITEAINKAKSVAGFSIKIEVECQNSDEALEAANAGADIVMLDNHTADELKLGASIVKKSYPNVLIEASGGIIEENMHTYMSPDVDIISRGSLTQGYSCIDFSLKITKN